MAEEELAAAKQAEGAVVHGDSLGLLHGVPVTVKDSFDIAGLPTLAGSRFRLGHRAESDATSVARLGAADAVILGKTNTTATTTSPAAPITPGTWSERRADRAAARLQIVVRPYSEKLILEVAVRLEEARGPFPGPAGFGE